MFVNTTFEYHQSQTAWCSASSDLLILKCFCCVIPVATAKINRVATNIFILKRKGMPANHKTKQRSHDQRKRVRESVTRGEGMSTPRAHRTRWYPRLCLKLWVSHKSTLIWTTMNAECREKKRLCSHGPYPAAFVSFLQNQSYRSSAN